MTPRQYLQQARRINALIASAMNELQQIRSWTEGFSADSKEPPLYNGLSCSTGTAENHDTVDLEAGLRREIRVLVSKREEIRRTIDSLDDRDERLLLRLRYINGLTWEQIAANMSYTMTQLHRIHDRALKHIQYPKN